MPHTAAARTLPLAPRRVRRLALAVLILATLVLSWRAARNVAQHDPDFEFFYKAGRALLEHGTLDPGYDLVNGKVVRRGGLDWYWPAVPRVMTLFAVFPFEIAGLLWLTMNIAAVFIILRLLGRHVCGLPPADWPVTMLVPYLLLIAYWRWEFILNQINILTLLLMVASFVVWQQGRRGIAGFWLGLAVLLKLTPGVLVIWFLLKRQWRTVGVATLTVVLAGPVADAITLRPTLAYDAYRGWADNALQRGSHGGLIRHELETDWRNQGLGAVIGRWLTPTNYNTHFDNDPRHQAHDGSKVVKLMNVADLPRATAARIATGIAIASLLALMWLARRPAKRCTSWQLRIEWSLFLLAMLWLMPVMRRYHMIWTLPALAVLAGTIHYAGFRAGWSRFALVCIALAVLAQAAMINMRAEAAGPILASVLVLALPLIVLRMRLNRRPACLPPPANGDEPVEPAR